MPKIRATVHVSHRVSQPKSRNRKGRTGPRKLWAFGYADLADLLGVHPGSVRRLVARGKLDPGDLRSLVEVALGKKGGRRRFAMGLDATGRDTMRQDTPRRDGTRHN